MSARQVLLNPGPVTLSPRVRAALTEGDWCHREPEFAALTRANNAALAAVYDELAGDYSAVTLTGSGTAAVEGMLAAFAPADARTLVLANGVYGERMARILESHGRAHTLLKHEWTAAPDLAAVAAALEADPGITHVAAVHHETTTGRLNDIDALGALCRTRNVGLLLDAVSSFGAERIAGADWNLAALAATANKCLHGVPGLSFVLARDALWAAPPAAPVSVYFDLHGYHRAQHGDGFSPFTQAVQVAFALREALAELAEQGGWAARRDTYLLRARRIAAALAAHGVTTLLPPDEYSSVLWSYRLPPGMNYPALHDALKPDGFVIYAGQGGLGSEIFRIAQMGDISDDDLARLEASLARALP